MVRANRKSYIGDTRDNITHVPVHLSRGHRQPLYYDGRSFFKATKLA
jgi:hypothetical protein